MNYDQMLVYINEVAGNETADMFKEAHEVIHKTSGTAYIDNLNIVIHDHQESSDANIVTEVLQELKEIFLRILLDQGIKCKDLSTLRDVTYIMDALDKLLEYEHKDEIMRELESSIIETEKLCKVFNIVTGRPHEVFSEPILSINPSLVRNIHERMKYEIKIEQNKDRIAPYAKTYGTFLKVHEGADFSNQFAYDIDSIGLPFSTYTRIMFGRYELSFKDNPQAFAYALVGCACIAIDAYADPITAISKELESAHFDLEVINKVTIIVRNILNEMSKL
jgi:hypothetical protein